MKRYELKYTVPCYDTDASWRMKPASFMNIAQEAAGNHAVYLGFGYDTLRETNTAWILSRVHVEFPDTPLWREDLTLQTWHKGLNRLFFLRDFVITDNEGKERVKATTSWLVLNLETRKLVRDPKLMEDGTICTDNVDAVLDLMSKQSELMKKGLVIVGNDWENPVEFKYEGLNDIKPAMIEEATQNAREAAEKFAKDSGSRLGKIKNANQGTFTIENRDSNTPYIKKVRVVTSVTYYLKN